MASKESSNRTQLIIIIVFTVLVFLSIGITSFTVIQLQASGSGDGSSYRSVTMTDAYLDCENRLKSQLGTKLKSYGADNLSTRYNQKKERFLIFFRAQVKEVGSAGMVDNYITCEVSKSGRIQSFFVALENETGDGIERKEKGNPFGYDF